LTVRAPRALPGARCLLAAGLLVAGAAGAQDALREGFASPPAAARPHVWWHWADGNIDVPGLRADLAWMQRVGVAGAVVAESGLPTPQVVQTRLAFGTPGWQAAVRTVAGEADRLGLTMGVFSSGGWSISGGPWVTAEDAMRKLVWSRLVVQQRAGQRKTSWPLPALPDAPGPYQDIHLKQVGRSDGPRDVRPVAVVAYRLPAGRAAMPLQPAAWQLSETLPTMQADSAPELLNDGRHDRAVVLRALGDEQRATVQLQFPTPTTVRAVSAGLPAPRGFGSPVPASARLEASDDDLHWRLVVELPATASPLREASFAPVRARAFRLTLWRPAGAKGFAESQPLAPGALPMRLPPAPPPDHALTEFVLHADGRVHAAPEKAGFATLPDYHAAATAPAAVHRPVRRNDVVDLGSRIDAAGVLHWTPPPGTWVVLRLGASLTGKRNGPAPTESTGLEVDKFDARRVQRYLDGWLDRIQAATGPALFGAAGVRSLQIDSIESGAQNWSDVLPAEFRRRRGYALWPWLPALTGEVIGSAGETDRFLYDFRRTLAELHAHVHQRTLAEGARARGLQVQAEALEDHRPQLGDDLEMRRHADIPMGAMWTLLPGVPPRPTYEADLRGAASVAHVWGRPLVGAESFSTFGHPWAHAPRHLKATADRMLALGVNRFYIHSSAHQPSGMAPPGLALSTLLGQYFNRHDTWADMAGAWVDYLSRSAYLMQQGRPQADVAVFIGEEAPVTALYGDRPFDDVPAGHAWDFVNAEALSTALRVENGALVNDAGSRWPLLLLAGSSQKMTVATMQRLHALLRGGARVVGPAPEASPSLADRDADFLAWRRRIWGGCAATAAAATVVPVGHGRLWCGADRTRALIHALGSLGLAADGVMDGVALHTLRRELPGGGAVVFVSNPEERPVQGQLRLRHRGFEPEWWHAEDGRIEPAGYRRIGDELVVDARLPAHGAAFIVLRRPGAAVQRHVPEVSWRETASLQGPWQLQFAPGRGAPESLQLDSLSSWSENALPGVRHFSGIATYRLNFEAAGTLPAAARTWLDLGEVAEIAEVSLNGHSLGTLWHPPFRVDVTGALRPGSNLLEVRVANVWANRLIGDAQPGAERVAYTSAPTYRADAPLRPSGLLGPVRLLEANIP
jgi:hypothetical protein